MESCNWHNQHGSIFYRVLFQIGMIESNWESKLDYDSLWIRNPLKYYCCVCIHAGSIPFNKECRPLTTEVISNNATTTPEARFNHQTQPTNGCPAGIKHACIYAIQYQQCHDCTNNPDASPPPQIQFMINSGENFWCIPDQRDLDGVLDVYIGMRENNRNCMRLVEVSTTFLRFSRF